MTRQIHFAGRAIRLAAQGKAANDLVDFMFGRMPEDGAGVPHITFNLDDSPDHSSLLFRIPEVENWTVRGSASQIVTRLLYEVDYHLANLCDSGLYLHAASLARDGQGLLMPASSGSGKSTLTYWLTRHGFEYLSDESSFIPLNTTTCSGFTRPAHLKRGSMELFSDLQTCARLDVRQAEDSLSGWLVSTAELNPSPTAQPVPIKTIVFPRYQVGADFNAERLSPARAAFDLAGCLTNARNLEQHGFPEILRLARALPAWRITYGRLGQLEEFFDQALKNV